MPGRSVLVTGAARGIGAAIAARYRADGWRVVAPSRAELDLADAAAVARFCARADLGEIDVLVNNAGENVLGRIDALPDADLQRMMQTNLLSVWALVRRFAGPMADRRWGRVVNVASIYGIKSRAARGAYTASKAGLIALTKTAAIEYGAGNVLVNAIAPGFVDTEMTRRNNTPEQIAALCEHVPLGRLASTDEIAVLAAWLGGEANTYVTGQTVAIDGGFLIQ
ncbi:MAG TPA: SDR family oxidoreductase [Dongiaceae bacterium]|nr:SDR family oxidoreductase [Dongiaceae bacterium]